MTALLITLCCIAVGVSLFVVGSEFFAKDEPGVVERRTYGGRYYHGKRSAPKPPESKEDSNHVSK